MLKDYRLINDNLTPKRILEVLAADDSGAYDARDCNLELEVKRSNSKRKLNGEKQFYSLSCNNVVK